MVIAIDVATDRLNCIALEADGSLAAGRVYAAHELGALTAWAAEATVIAIDAPAELSTEPHAAEDALSPKFRRARRAEIALGRDHGIWIPGRARRVRRFPDGSRQAWSCTRRSQDRLAAS